MIKKTSETTPAAASVVNQKNNSTTDAYSCDYVNNMFTISEKQIASSYSVNSGSDFNIEYSYTPTKSNCCIVGYNVSGSYSTWCPPTILKYEDGKIYYSGRNSGGGTASIYIKVKLLEW